jgi:hypothetical protein
VRTPGVEGQTSFIMRRSKVGLSTHALERFRIKKDGESMRFNDPAGANAGSAHPGSLMDAADYHPNSLQVGIPASFCNIMGVTDIVSK